MTRAPAPLRDPRPRWRIGISVGLMLLVGAVAVSVVARRKPPARPETPAGRDLPAFDRLYFDDVVHSAYDDGRKLWTLSIHEMVHRKRKVGPLTLNPVKEVEMTGVRIEVDRSAVMPAQRADVAPDRAAVPPDRAASPPEGPAASLGLDLPFRKILNETLAAKDLGFVSRVLVNRIEMTVLFEGKPLCGIKAAEAGTGSTPDLITFRGGVTVTGRAGARLEAGEAEWRAESRILFVRGPFTLHDAAGRHDGANAGFRIETDGAIVRQ